MGAVGEAARAPDALLVGVACRVEVDVDRCATVECHTRDAVVRPGQGDEVDAGTCERDVDGGISGVAVAERSSGVSATR